MTNILRCLTSKLFILFVLANQSFSFAQEKEKDWAFVMAMQEANMSFNMPSGYLPFASLESYECGDGKLTGGYKYAIINKDSSVAIAFSVLNQSASSIEMTKRINPKYDENKNWLVSAKHLADTVHHQLVFYDKVYLKETFNADDGGEYIRACTLPYHKNFPNVRTVFFHKYNGADVTMTYFYTDKVKKKIGKCMQKTAGILRFNETL